MDIQQIRFLREIEVTDHEGRKTIQMEFSCDDGVQQTPHFFGIAEDDLSAAQSLYQAWGGSRPEGYRVGTTVRSPLWPAYPSRTSRSVK